MVMTRIFFVCVLIFWGFSSLSAGSSFHENPHEPWGVDSDLPLNNWMNGHAETARKVNKPSTQICKAMIRFFQIYISPIDGPRSHFYPTSSQYALQAIQTHGVFKGIAMGCDRLMRENADPWVYPVKANDGIKRKLDPVR